MKPPAAYSPRTSRVTLKTIAEEAGVSTAAVSLVLNNRAEDVGLSAETCERIKKIAARLRYIPNQLARNLRTRASRSLGIFWPLGSPDEQPFASHLMQGLHQRGYSAHFMDNSGSPQEALEALQYFLGNRVDGVVFYIQPNQEDSRTVKLLREQLSFFPSSVVVARDPSGPWPGDFVLHDDSPALAAICRHFVAQGRDLAVVGPISGSPRKNQRVAVAWKNTGGDPAGLSFIDSTAFGAVSDPSTIRAALEHEGWPRSSAPTALFTYRDENAAAALAAVQSMGRRVPEDVALCGFSNDPVSPFTTPALATVNRHSADIAPVCLELIFTRLEKPDLAPRQTSVAMTFIHRASAG